MLEKERIRRIIRDHKITSFEDKDEEELANIFYDAFNEFKHDQEDNLSTKEDIRAVMQIMETRFEASNQRFEDMYKYMDKRFEEINRKFTMMFTFMNIGFGILVLLTVLFKFLD